MLNRFLRLLVLVCFTVPFSTAPAYADKCSDAARELVASEKNATLLSVQMEAGNNGGAVCIVRMKIDSGDGNPPRVVVRRIKA